MGQVDLIRRKVLVEGWRVRKAAQVLGHSRNTIRKYLKESEPERKETAPRPRPVADLVEPRIDVILLAWGPRTTPKQRVTAKRLHRQLVEEGYGVGITVVTDYMRELRRRRLEAFVPLEYRRGDMAQVDFFEVTVDVGGGLLNDN